MMRYFSSNDNENLSEPSDADGQAESLDNFNGKDIINEAITNTKKILQMPQIIQFKETNKNFQMFFFEIVSIYQCSMSVLFYTWSFNS